MIWIGLIIGWLTGAAFGFVFAALCAAAARADRDKEE